MLHLDEGRHASANSVDDIAQWGIGEGGIMRRTIHIACAAILFIMSLAAVYVFFGTVDLHLSALLGAGLCFFVALWVLWGDFLQSGDRRL